MSTNTPSTNKVLIPIDEAEFGLHVLPYVTRLLEPDKNELILLHVAPVPSAVMVGDEVVVYADQETASMQALCTQPRGVRIPCKANYFLWRASRRD